MQVTISRVKAVATLPSAVVALFSRSTASSKTFRSKQLCVARLGAVWTAIMLCVLANIEGFVALGTSEAGRMPVFTKRRLLFSEVDLFTTFGALHGYFFE